MKIIFLKNILYMCMSTLRKINIYIYIYIMSEILNKILFIKIIKNYVLPNMPMF